MITSNRFKKGVFWAVLGAFLFLSFTRLYAFREQGCDLNDKTCGSVIAGEVVAESGELRPDSVQEQERTGSGRIKGSEHAAITIIAYTDFLSPASAKMVKVLDAVMKLYPDDIRLMFKPFPSLKRSDALLAHEAVMAAEEQKKFGAMQERLFAHKGEITEKALLQYAQQLKMDTQRFSLALTRHRFREEILQEMTEAKGFGVTDAPTLFINGRKVAGARSTSDLKIVMDEALGLRKPSLPSSPSVEVERTMINIAGAHAKGPEEASVVIVEFSDFQCPFCARGVSTLKNISARYPKQVRWVFKHFPLDFHPEAPLAHAAALAAGEQGKFWEMHDLIFLRQQAMKRDHLFGYAKELKLDIERFTKDMESQKSQDVIRADLQEGQQAGVDGTPTFFINGRRLVGARPIEDFVAIIEDELRLARAPTSSENDIGMQSLKPVTGRAPLLGAMLKGTQGKRIFNSDALLSGSLFL